MSVKTYYGISRTYFFQDFSRFHFLKLKKVSCPHFVCVVNSITLQHRWLFWGQFAGCCKLKHEGATDWNWKMSICLFRPKIKLNFSSGRRRRSSSNWRKTEAAAAAVYFSQSVGRSLVAETKKKKFISVMEETKFHLSLGPDRILITFISFSSPSFRSAAAISSSSCWSHPAGLERKREDEPA